MTFFESLINDDIWDLTPNYEGWLTKKSQFIGKWRKRWICIHNNAMYTFRYQSIYENPTEIIILDPIFTKYNMTQFCDDNGYYILTIDNRLVLRHKNDKKMYYFRSKNKNEIEMWYHRLRMYIKDVKYDDILHHIKMISDDIQNRANIL